MKLPNWIRRLFVPQPKISQAPPAFVDWFISGLKVTPQEDRTNFLRILKFHQRWVELAFPDEIVPLYARYMEETHTKEMFIADFDEEGKNILQAVRENFAEEMAAITG